MTTDAGIDLVVYSPVRSEAATARVKTVERAMPAGGTGKLTIGWNFPHGCPAQILAAVSLDEDKVWLFTIGVAQDLGQQHSSSGTWRLYWYTDEAVGAQARGQSETSDYLLEARADSLFLTVQ
ncbi:hypothetical protein KIV56_17100 [Cryobacterium breve]|uniref:Uncharacterized protein n=1 Tax=Cryobacterium breve TaxID=1259258 RepID=A0ABY7NBH7_9MICO|nr:hypothetical protein [Cryobacterium breve]WBM79864.1 hypothetical protein KIV56_17100 [Cryobacterium breve]